VRLAKITENGWVRSSFLPPQEIRVLRTCTRYRRKKIQVQAAEKNRVEGLLEEGHLKLSSVISDIHGVSGRDMLGALAAGVTDPGVLAAKARGVMKVKIPRIAEALDCSFWTVHHAWLLRRMLDTLEYLAAQIAELDAEIAVLCAPFEAGIARLDDVQGIARRTAEDVIAEIGVNMTVFPTAAHLVSWSKFCPQIREPAGRRKGRNATGEGNVFLSAAISEAVIGSLRTDSFIAARYKRLIRRMPKKKALVAAGNSMLTIIWHLLDDPEATYANLGADYYERLDPARHKRSYVRGLERLGYHVTIHTINPDTGELTAARPPATPDRTAPRRPEHPHARNTRQTTPATRRSRPPSHPNPIRPPAGADARTPRLFTDQRSTEPRTQRLIAASSAQPLRLDA
jgi:transposase